MSSVLIRPRVDDDLPTCVEMLRSVHEAVAYPLNWPDDPAAWITPDDALGIWVATTYGRIAGHVVLAAHEEGTRVERLYVDPASTGQGLRRGPAAWGGDRVREVVYFTAPR